MPYELFLALRYLYSRRRRPLARVTALAAIAGIVVGVAALIVALALANGFRDEMRDKVLRGTAHITLARRDGQLITDWRALLPRVREVDGVTEASPTTYHGALLSGPNGSAYAVLRGVDKDSGYAAVSEIRRALIAGAVESLFKDEDERTNDEVPGVAQSEAPAPDVVIGAELAARTGLRVTDVAQVVSGEGPLTPLEFTPRYGRVRVAGVFRSGLYEYDATWVYASLATAASFADQPATTTDRAASPASVISVEVADIYGAAQVAARVREKVGETFTTIDWQEANRPLFAALELERRMGILIIALIVLIAALNITTTLVFVVVERRRDIATLLAMGARKSSIMLIFVIEGATIGVIGALGGILLGLIACYVGDHYQLVSLPADVYSLSNVPFRPRGRDVALSALVALGLSLLATVYPARAASRMRPAEALRDGG